MLFDSIETAEKMNAASSKQSKLGKISVLGAFGLSIGTAIGWGSFVVTGSSYLSKAGPIGSLIGLAIGMLIMIAMAYNYHRMMSRFPDGNGGIYAFTKNAFGADHAFLSSWFLIITYFAILWANATSIPLFARYIFGNAFQFGFHYQIGGYDVFLGEILLSAAFILLFGGFCMLDKRITTHVEFGLAMIFIAAVLGVFIAAMALHQGGLETYKPGFSTSGENEFLQIMGVVSMSPWAFIGFESISNSSKDFSFRHKNVFRVLLISVVATTLIYAFLCLISVAAFPEEYGDWHAYLADIGNLSGLKGIPPFFVAEKLLGLPGKVIFIIALLAIVTTSLIGNMMGLSNLLQSMADDGALPRFLSKQNKWGSPHIALLLIMGISVVMSFVGRAAIGWIVDVNTIGGSIVYGYISVCALHFGRKEKNKKEIGFGILGILFAAMFGLLMILPNLFGSPNMAKESFFIFVVWSILGFIYFRFLLKKDEKGIYGGTVVVWFGLFLLIIFSSTIWLTQIIKQADETMVDSIAEHFSGKPIEEDEFVLSLKRSTDASIVAGIVTASCILLVAQMILFSVFHIIKGRESEQTRKRIEAEQLAQTDAMTGVKNKLAYFHKETAYNKRIDANEEGLAFAIVVCDVNDLKFTNDTKGHDVGDTLIKDACAMICKNYKHSPVFRIGGDEFAVILEGEDYHNREALLQKMDGVASNGIAKNIAPVVATGMAEYIPGKSTSFASVFRIADQAMYAHKMRLKGKFD